MAKIMKSFVRKARVCENFFEVTSYISWIKGGADFSCEHQAGVVPTRSL